MCLLLHISENKELVEVPGEAVNAVSSGSGSFLAMTTLELSLNRCVSYYQEELGLLDFHCDHPHLLLHFLSE